METTTTAPEIQITANGDYRVTGNGGTRYVGQGSRNNRAGWVVYRGSDDQRVSDPVFSSRDAALKHAAELCA